jgi:hypothetical protein
MYMSIKGRGARASFMAHPYTYIYIHVHVLLNNALYTASFISEWAGFDIN